MDLHVLVDGNILYLIYAIADAVNEKIRKTLPGIVDVLVHIGPIQEHGENHKAEGTSSNSFYI